MPSGLADDGTPRKTASVVAVNVAPDEPPIRGEVAEGEAHASSHSFKNNLNTMHGQPLPSSFYFTKEIYRRYPHSFLRPVKQFHFS